MLHIVRKLACDYCPTVMRSRVNESVQDLYARAERSGWKRLFGMPAAKYDACQVCAPKVGD